MTAHSKYLIEGARIYAKADKSDPFTLDRCMAHIRAGIVTSDAPYNAKKSSHYEAVTVERPDGTAVPLRSAESGRLLTKRVTSYHSMKRP